MRKYTRDKRSPTPSSALASKTMSAIRSKNTKPELIFRRLLSANGQKGYRIHWKSEGRPDIAFVGKKLAIFIHGCFWHGCPYCKLPTPRSNSSFWKEKLNKNMERDGKKQQLLEAQGWHVLVFWECVIKKDALPLVLMVKKILTDVDK